MAPRKKKQTKAKEAARIKETAKTDMHPALRAKQIVKAVADEVGAKNGRTLVSMALACRALFDPAMDTLWCDLGDPMRLIHILPGHRFDLKRDDLTGYTIVEIIEKPSEADWQRFSDYTRRVKMLCCYARSDHRCSTLDYYLGEQRSPIFRIYFPSPPPQCDHLEVFNSPTLRLEHFETTVPVPRALSALASISTLRHLDLAIGDVDLNDVPSPAFPALQYLRVEAATNHVALLRLMRNVAAPSLLELNLSVKVPLANKEEISRRTEAMVPVEALFGVVSRFLLLRSFSFLYFWQNHWAYSSPVYSIHWRTLLSLSSLRYLEKLDLSAVPMALADADLDALARAWPKIEELRLYDLKKVVWDFQDRSFLQVDALLSFARFCPLLRVLGLPMEISLDTSYREGDELPPPLALETLWVSNIDATEVREDDWTVRLLAAVLPYAQIKWESEPWDPSATSATSLINTLKAERVQFNIMCLSDPTGSGDEDENSTEGEDEDEDEDEDKIEDVDEDEDEDEGYH
ncbi:hypothetical protein PsYK624_118610 [Phanerochaete sordida]|uniref:F-box domain-containing protein n=1 Tax=Phanerochaete sordida TaxID=48140 RepID=A0A9P3GIF6_9APHY|nr:hypothetical protein PsYK624_118610 [Phanerochaete sordida]